MHATHSFKEQSLEPAIISMFLIVEWQIFISRHSLSAIDNTSSYEPACGIKVPLNENLNVT